MDTVGFEVQEDSILRILLVETHVGVAVAFLNAHYEIADDGNARTIASKPLVGHLGIVLLRLDKLVVEVKVVGIACHKQTGAQEYLHKKAALTHGCIDVVTATCLRGVGGVGGAQILNVGGWCQRRKYGRWDEAKDNTRLSASVQFRCISIRKWYTEAPTRCQQYG